MKYTAINIGPVVPTISMGRRPREIWAASYIFSLLMQCIIAKIKEKGVDIISPATLDSEEKTGVGLYPDRVYVQGEFNVQETINTALNKFEKLTGVSKEYVNVMHVTIDVDATKESPIKRLNQLLDTTELCNRPIDSESRQSVIDTITKGYESPLHLHAFGKSGFHIPFIAEMATISLKNKVDGWENLCKKFSKIKTNKEISQEEDNFYQSIKDRINDKFFSYYKYICIVQADGDNMGKIVSSVDTENVKKISKSLLNYGKSACAEIKSYGGLPIYAGGDDLLFIAPVRSEKGSIFDLVDKIDALYKREVDNSIDSFRPNGLHTNLSYGLSIGYYKFPLYEAFKEARDQLFTKAKNVDGKNAISWQLRKHSGTGFVGGFTKAMPTEDGKKTLYSLFKEILQQSVDEKLISAISHKLKANEGLLDILFERYKNSEHELRDRITNFYKKFMEDIGDSAYITLTKELLYTLMINYNTKEEESENNEENQKSKITPILENLYGILRTAKFIKGEGDKDE